MVIKISFKNVQTEYKVLTLLIVQILHFALDKKCKSGIVSKGIGPQRAYPLFTTPKKNTICAAKQPSKATNQHHSPNGDCVRFLRVPAQISESQTDTKSKSSEGENFYHLKQRRKIFSPKFILPVNFLTDSLLTNLHILV